MDAAEMRQVKFFKAWAIFLVMSTVGSAAVGFLVGAAVGALMGVLGTPVRNMQAVASLIGIATMLPVSFLIYRWSVKQFILKQL